MVDRGPNGEPWSASWVRLPAVEAPCVVVYRCGFAAASPISGRLRVSADERYVAYLDGELLGRGPCRSDLRHWAFETYAVDLKPGPHHLVVRVWSAGEATRPMAQLSAGHGLLVQGDGVMDALVSTGKAAWRAHRVRGVTHLPPPFRDACNFAGGTQRIDARAVDWPAYRGESAEDAPGWEAVEAVEPADDRPFDAYGQRRPGRVLHPSEMPAMMERPWRGGAVRYAGPSVAPVRMADADRDATEAWARWWRGETDVVSVPPRRSVCVVIDLEAYLSAYVRLDTDGGRGARIDLGWAEALFRSADPHGRDKANRDRVDGLYYHGKFDEFWADGSACSFEPLWFRSGRYLCLRVQADEEALVLRRLTLCETRYPLETVAWPSVEGDPRLRAGLERCGRSLLTNLHETYFDCPYYEQLMYVGDTRLQCLVTYVLSADSRAPRRAIRSFGWSLMSGGLTQARYPSELVQVIGPFALWWVCMLHDYALWRGDPAFIRGQMAVARAVVETYRGLVGDDGLLGPAPGWNFVDWVAAWDAGVPPRADTQPSGPLTWQFIYTLQRKSRVERWLGEGELAGRDEALARRLAEAAREVFFDADRDLYADTPDRKHFSQHTQSLAAASGLLSEADGRALMRVAVADDRLSPVSIYFKHYLLEALSRGGLDGAFYEQLETWRELAERGLLTTPESPEPTRSDNHGWGAHPIYHLVTHGLGVRPAGLGFEDVEIRPALGPLDALHGRVAHRDGVIDIRVERDADSGEPRCRATLPPKLASRWRGPDWVRVSAGPSSKHS
ncbi:MAG: alpha-L-rhamnosidase [Planctomycetota bacterium]